MTSLVVKWQAGGGPARARESPYLLIVTGADVVVLPVVSVATAVIVCWPLASADVFHQSSKVHDAAPPQTEVRVHSRKRKTLGEDA